MGVYVAVSTLRDDVEEICFDHVPLSSELGWWNQDSISARSWHEVGRESSCSHYERYELESSRTTAF